MGDFDLRLSFGSRTKMVVLLRATRVLDCWFLKRETL
jgi:hypothetical protein